MNRTAVYAALAVVPFAAAAALADHIDARFTGTGDGRTVRITNAGESMNVFAGQLKHLLTDGENWAQNLEGLRRTYCVDLDQYVSSHTREFDVVATSQVPAGAPMGLAKALALDDMFDFAAGRQSDEDAGNDYAAAFQIAVWEVVRDYDPSAGLGSLDVTSGNFRATRTNGQSLWGDVRDYIGGLFGAIGSNPADTQMVFGLSSDRYQDQLVSLPVPTPGSIATAALGVMCFASRRRPR